MGINLCCTDIFVSQILLNDSNIGTLLKKMCCGGMTKSVRSNIFLYASIVSSNIMASTILDRLLHHSYPFFNQRKSLRMKNILKNDYICRRVNFSDSNCSILKRELMFFSIIWFLRGFYLYILN